MSRGAVQRLSAEILRGDDPSRYVDLRIDLRVEDTEELLLEVGGRWDTHSNEWSGDGERFRELHVTKAQLEAARWHCRWLCGFLADKHEPDCEDIWSSLLGGPRGGGKTDFVGKFAAMFAVAVTRGRVWAVSPAQDETEELRDVLEEVLHPSWYVFSEEQARYYLVNGSRISLHSGYKPSSLKRGRVDLAILNEAQEMSERAFAKVRGGNRKGGLTILAANPPDRVIGRWIDDYYLEAKAGRRQAKVFDIRATDNPWINHASLEAMKNEVDEMTYRRDVKGEFGLPLGDVVNFAWSPALNVRETPVTGDCTAAFLKRFWPGRDFQHCIGMDFDKSPYLAAVEWRAFVNPDEPDDPLLWVPAGRFWTVEGNEDDLVDELERDGLDARATAVVADASGEFQATERRPGRNSFAMLRRRGWLNLFKPVADSEANPHILERCATCNARWKSADGKRHAFSDPANLTLNDALKSWEMKNGFPFMKSKHAHLNAAAGYPLVRFYPRLGAKGSAEYTSLSRFKRRDELKGIF